MKNTWFTNIFDSSDILSGKLSKWLNELENDPKWRMTFAEKLLVLPDGRVVVLICCEPNNSDEH